ncbi:hypothetical protein [Amycolatopsis australiensis]|uniref:Uncharacterized protein n=1 Tax=Amycolatopsis australiensis TaxID=546364 RepID=A0A1K1LPG8_9PSEU|nr:hypothetical protein [Amycolatopsis australiensis]SFW12759.1 hypothetical protein SAMN04489730_0109 [Amycolatopsis australiensis]
MTDPRPPKPTYLDDPDLQLVIEPGHERANAGDVLAELLHRQPNAQEAALLIRGATMLYTVGAGSAAACLSTSMTWLYG